MLKRVAIYLLTNFLILVVLGVVLSVLTALGFIDPSGGGMMPMLIIATVFGFGGSLVSLALSKTMAKWTTRARIIEQPSNQTEAWLIETVRRQAQAAGIGMPDVAVYPGPELNAFATGMRRNSALVAVSEGLLRGMKEPEIEAVLAHEVSHVANGDMVTLALVQGVLNTFVIFLSRVLGGVIDSALSRGERRRGAGPAYYLVVFLLEMLFGVLATIVVMWFSRQREYRADAGSARIEGREKMVAALQRLQGGQASSLPSNMQAFGIAGGGGLMSLFRSHPPIEERIARLRAAA